MPRIVRDSDEEIEAKSYIRRTRASTAANITDSPLRRNTRSNKQLTVIESSPESLDDSNAQPIARTTRSRVATLDKAMATTVVKGLRSRKTSGSSDVSESIEVESEAIEKRITRRNKTTQSTVGTPTKANLRSRNVRAGSEAKSTPPSRNKRVTRSNSVDPISNLNESSGTPIKRKTRASIVPSQPTVTEDEEIKNKDGKSLETTVIEINEVDSEGSLISSKERSIKNSSNSTNDTNKDISNTDGENASTPMKAEEKQDKTQTKQTKNSQKRRSKANDSDSNESAENLFQDIAADEWLNETKQNRSSNFENFKQDKNKPKIVKNNSNMNSSNTSVLKESMIQEDNNSRINNNRKSFDEKEQVTKSLQQSPSDQVMNQKLNESTFKKIRKSIENKNESYETMDLKDLKYKENVSKIQIDNKSEDEIDSEKDENKYLNATQQSINRSLKLNKSQEEHKDDIIFKKSYKSIDTSLHLNQSSHEQNQNESISEKFITSMNNSNIAEKQFTFGISPKLLIEENDKNLSYELMEIDEENKNQEVDNKSLNESQKQLNKSQLNKSLNKNKKQLNKSELNNSSNESQKQLDKDQLNFSISNNKRISEKLSTSLNDSKKLKKNLTNNSLSKSLTKDQNEQNLSKYELEIDEDCEKNTNKYEEDNDKFEMKNHKSLSKCDLSSEFNQSDSQKKNEILQETQYDPLNNSKKLKNRLSETIQSHVLSHESSIKDQILKNGSDNEMEVEEDNLNLLNKKSNTLLDNSSSNKFYLFKNNEQTINNVENEVSFKDKDKSFKETSFSKSESDEDISSDTKTENKKNNNKSVNKSLNMSTKSRKSINYSSIKPLSIISSEDSDNTDESISNFSLNKKNGSNVNQKNDQLHLDKSIKKNTERMKFINPVKDDVSNTIQLESNSECEEVPEYKLHITDTEESENSEDDKEDSCSKDIDSDVFKEYNLSGKIIEKYSDDDVQGDDCRASEEEFSDSDDNGDDLLNFIIPDNDIENTEDESEDEQVDDESENQQEDDESENEEEDDESETQQEDDESENEQDNLSENEQEDNENRNSEDNEDEEDIKTVNLIKEMSVSNLKLKKNETVNNSKLKENERLDNSKSIKDKSINLSKSIKIKNELSKSCKSNANDSIIIDDKNIDISEKQYSKSLNSNSDDEVTKNTILHKRKIMSIVSPSSDSESESESENGEDSYQIITVNHEDTSCSRPAISKTKKLTPLIECSTPKPGITKKNDFSKGADSFVDRHSLPIASNKSNSIKQKSGSLNDLSDTKMVSSRLSIAEIPSKSMHDTSTKFKESIQIIDSPETVVKNRQAWKLIPLNQTVHTLSDETPLTKYLKKSKLNDSAPDSKCRKNGSDHLDTLSKKNASVNKNSITSFKKIQELEGDNTKSPEDKKSKKRKLRDISNPALANDDNTMKSAKKKKKRAHIEESVIEEAFQWEVQNKEPEEIQKDKKNKKKNHQNIKTEQCVEDVSDIVENAQLTKKKKKKKPKVLKVDECVLGSSQSSEDKQKKKKKAYDTELSAEDQEYLNYEATKHKKKKIRLENGELDQENLKPQKKSKLSSDTECHEKLKKSKRKGTDFSNEKDEVQIPGSVNFDETQPSVFTAVPEVETIKASKQSRKKKQKVISNEKTNLKRLPDDVLEDLTDEPKRGSKRQKLSSNLERKILPSTSMFSPGKRAPLNLRVDDGYVPLNSTGGTTEFGVVNLEKAKKISKKSAAALNFRERVLSRNLRQPTSTYLMYLKKQKCKNSI